METTTTNPGPAAASSPATAAPTSPASPSAAPARTFRQVAPPPSIARPPPRRAPAAPRGPEPAQATAPTAPAPSRWRQLSADPEERAAQRKSVSGEAAALIEMLDGVVQGVPPGTPLADWEKGAITPPLEEVIYKYGANVDPAITLGITLGGIFLMRWQAAKKIAAENEKRPENVGAKIDGARAA